VSIYSFAYTFFIIGTLCFSTLLSNLSNWEESLKKHLTEPTPLWMKHQIDSDFQKTQGFSFNKKN